jgi:peptide/bleomycin uptake transporter
MNEYYTEHWQQLRHVEGASQRVQEDTMRFATIVEDLGVEFVKSVMTLIAFLPLLFQLSKHVPVFHLVKYNILWCGLPLHGQSSVQFYSWGKKLPGLQFNNQKVEAAYRKELVYGEDHADRADPATLKEFLDVFVKIILDLFSLCLF